MWKWFLDSTVPGHPKISCLKALWPRDDSRSKSLGACGHWNSCTSAGRRPIDGPGEPTVPARGTWAGLSWRTGAASEGSVLFWLSTPLLPKRGRRSWEHVVFVLCFWPAQWHCGFWQSCQGKLWNSELTWSVKRRFLSLWEEPGSWHICVGRALCYSVFKSFCSWPVWLTVLPAPKTTGSVTGRGTCHSFRLHPQ